MLEFALWAGGLLSPVAALAFIALRRRRRVAYPHGLLPSARSARRSGPLFRRLRAGYDTALDAAAALAAAAYLASAIAGTRMTEAGGQTGAAARSGRSAMVLDCSASMRWGRPGARPLDAAAREAFEATRARSPAALYLLSAERGSATPILRRADALIARSSSPEDFAAALELTEPFLGVDYALLSDPKLDGYASVILVCDELGPEARGFDVMELGWREPEALIPAAIRPTGGPWASGWGLASFIASGGAAAESLSVLGADGTWRRPPPEAWRIEPNDEPVRVYLRDPGRYRLSWGGGELEFELAGLKAPERPPARSAPRAGADPSPAERARRVVAAIVEGSGAGRADEPIAAAIEEGGGRGRPGSLSLSRAESGADGLVIDPGTARGALAAAGWDAQADLSLGDAALADGDAALAVWTAWEGRALDAARLPSARLLVAGGASGSVRIELAAVPLDEWHRPTPGGEVERSAGAVGAAGRATRLGLLAALAALYLAKLAMRRRSAAR